MRNRVYEALLVDDRGRRRATPQLLRTRQQINNEAKGLLYTSSSLTLDATFWVSDNVWAKGGERERRELTDDDSEWISWHGKNDVEKEYLAAQGYSPPSSPRLNPVDPDETKDDPRYYRPCLINGDCTFGPIAAQLSLRAATKFWPRKIYEIPIIKLSVTLALDPVFSTQDTVPNFLTFNHFIYSLVSSLSASTKPQELVLAITDGGLCSSRDLQDYLYPLGKLPQNIDLDIITDPPANLEWIEQLRSDKDPSLKYDLLADCVQLDEHMRSITMPKTSRGHPYLAESAARSVRGYINRMLGGLDWGSIDEEDERNCFKAVALTEEAIKHVPGQAARKAAWVAKMRVMVAELKGVSREYWWSWDAIREEAVDE